ncbi:MAG: hypothetical protein ABR589_11295, partial [Chthoniobacterales bacterium]
MGSSIGARVDLDFNIGPAYYNFVDIRYIGEPRLRERIFAPSQNITYINKTVNVTNITYNNKVVYNHGPDINRVNAYSTRPIQRLKLQRKADAAAAAQAGGMTKVEGDQLVVAAPQTLEKPAKPVAPKEVKKKIEKPDVETGWADVSDPKAKAELQEKIRKEDPKKVPPPDIQPTNPAALSAGAGADAAAQPGDAKRPGKGKGAQADQQAGGTEAGAPPTTAAAPAEADTTKGKGKNKRGQAEPAG